MKYLGFFIVIVFLSACSIQPVEKQSSEISLPQTWKNSQNLLIQSNPQTNINHLWWQEFNDPILNNLMQQGLANNLSIKLATARIEESRAYQKGILSTLFPFISGAANVDRGNQGVMGNDKIDTTSNASIQANWEVDLFGKNQARTAKAIAITQSEEANRHAVMIALLADIARNYFDLRGNEKQIQIIQKNLNLQQKTYAAIKARQEAGIDTMLDVERASVQLHTTQSLLPPLIAGKQISLHRLNILLGKTPGTIDNQLQSQKNDFYIINHEQILLAAPANVLNNRPDVQAAERLYAASISGQDVAFKELFPTINLFSFFGVEDFGFASSNPYKIGAGLTQPILNFGQIANLKIADAQQKQAFITYKQTTLNALEDMENALTHYLNEYSRQQSLENAAKKSQKSVEIVHETFKAGTINILDVLLAEQNLLQTESTLAASKTKLYKDLIGIYTAAGGGWKVK